MQAYPLRPTLIEIASVQVSNRKYNQNVSVIALAHCDMTTNTPRDPKEREERVRDWAIYLRIEMVTKYLPARARATLAMGKITRKQDSNYYTV